MTTINMNEIKAKTYRDAYHRDGITEIGYGMILMWFASCFQTDPAPMFTSIWIAYLPLMILFARKLITQPRLGYVTIKPDMPIWLILVTILPLIVPAIAHIIFTRVINNNDVITVLYRFTPLSIAVALSISYLYASIRANMPVYRIPATIPLLGAIVLTFTDLAETKDATMIFSIIFGLIFLITGFIVMMLFIKNNPKVKEQ